MPIDTQIFAMVPKIALMLVAPSMVKITGPPQHTTGKRARTPKAAKAANVDLELFSPFSHAPFFQKLFQHAISLNDFWNSRLPKNQTLLLK